MKTSSYYCAGNFHCLTPQPALEWVNECGLCNFKIYSFNLSEKEVYGLIDWLNSVPQLDVEEFELPRLVPIVSVRSGRSIELARRLGVEAIIVPFTDLLEPSILRSVVELSIHCYLKFHGKVILSSIMPDELLVSWDVWNSFYHLIEAGGFDAVIGWDVPTYRNLPLYYSWVNLVKGLELTYRLSEAGVPVIALIKGNTPRQVEFSISVLRRMGFKNYALHVSEYLAQLNTLYARSTLYKIASEVRGKIGSLLVIGALRPWSMNYVSELFSGVEKLSIAGYSYYLDAERYRIYSGSRAINILDKYVCCSCPSCRGSNSKKLLVDTVLRALHNFNYLSILDGGGQFKCEIYDLVIDRGESALIVSDVHVWSEGSKFNEFINYIYSVKPNHLILLGDIFDFKYGSPSIQQLYIFFTAIRELKCTVHVVKGCCDGELSDFLRVLDKLVFGDKHRSMSYIEDLIGEEKIDFKSRALIDFYKLYRLAKSELTIKIPSGEVILALHGHQITLNPAEKFRLIRKWMLEYKNERSVDWLVIGHIHRAHIDYTKKIATLGCWQLPPKPMQKVVKKEDLFKAIKITGKGELVMEGEL